jgi:hypothetical protein
MTQRRMKDITIVAQTKAGIAGKIKAAVRVTRKELAIRHRLAEDETHIETEITNTTILRAMAAGAEAEAPVRGEADSQTKAVHLAKRLSWKG